MKILKFTTALLLLLMGAQAYPQTVAPSMSELQNISFITEAYGYTGTVLNPAGLARAGNDDGAFYNYITDKTGDRTESNFNFSMGNLAFGFQEFPLGSDLKSPSLNYYRMGIAIGGRVLSIGTSNKLIELQWPHHVTRAYSLDAGFIFQPMPWITLAGFGRDLDEPQLENIQFLREYQAGLSLNLVDQRVRIIGQAMWNDEVDYIEDARYKVGLGLTPIENSNLIMGAIHDPTGAEEFFAMAQVPIWQGIKLSLSGRFNDRGVVQRYFAAVYVPLKTVTF